MDAAKLNNINANILARRAKFELGGLIPALILMAVALFGGLLWWTLSESSQSMYTYLYLLPWIFLTTAIICAPSVVLLYQKKFDLFHPLVFAAWSYFGPAFTFGGLMLAFGLAEPFVMHLIDDPEYNLPLTFIYISLGFGGMSLGYALPWAKRIGRWLSEVLPTWNWHHSDVIFPSVILLAVGLFFFFSAWFAGVIGYQQINLADTLSSANYFFSMVMLEASLMLWLFIFKSKSLNLMHFLALCLIMIAVLSRVVLGGNRSALLFIVVLIAMAFAYSGRKIKLKHGVIFTSIGVVALLVGMIYGTTFRHIRGSEEKTSLTQYLEHSEQALTAVTTQDSTKTLAEGFGNLAIRLEIATSLAVVVSNYEKLAPYEAAYGLENNIWTYTWTAFIPRFIWHDKPVVLDARSYSDLYFNYGDNSFAMTPMGDLLRNFGPVGVPLGMMLLGFALRIIYAALIENQTVTIGHTTVYYMLLISVSYEGFYGAILPSLIRVGFVAAVSLLFVDFLVRSKSRVG